MTMRDTFTDETIRTNQRLQSELRAARETIAAYRATLDAIRDCTITQPATVGTLEAIRRMTTARNFA